MLDLEGYVLTFDEEFNSRSISQTGKDTTWADIRSNWRYDANSDIGFGHSSFVDPASGYDPFSVASGALTITAVKDRTKFGFDGSWESGLITTQGGFSQTYGYFEMRADMADAVGSWDAFWLLPDAPAANPGNRRGWQELDIVEHYGVNNKGSYSAIHTTDPVSAANGTGNTQAYSESVANLVGYHTYGMDWQKDTIKFYVDGKLIATKMTPSDMHGPMYLVANLATQGDADIAGVPISMKIDYIRVFSNNPDAVPVSQDTVSAPDGKDPGLYGAISAPAVDVPVSLRGDGTANILEGGSMGDRLAGLGGNDTLIGHLGRDVLTGGSGADTFVFETIADSGVGMAARDVIMDFTPGLDLIDLSGIQAVAGASTDQDFTFIGSAKFTKHAGELHTVKSSGSTFIEGDVNGDGKADFQITLKGLATPLGVSSFTPGSVNAPTASAVASETVTHATLIGTTGADRLVGGGGDDGIYGNAGRDVLTGKAGADTFIFTAITDSPVGVAFRDTLTDFTPGTDHLDLSGIQAVSGASADQAFVFVGGAAFSQQAGELHTVKSGGSTLIEGDVNGDGKADFQITLQSLAQTLHAGDFIL